MKKDRSRLTLLKLQGDPLRQTKIEITAPMIEAGVDAIYRFFGWELDDPERIVCSVYLAMTHELKAAMEAPSD